MLLKVFKEISLPADRENEKVKIVEQHSDPPA
jgi:hypothetical protein